MKKYEFRESGTCINPDIAFDISPFLPPSVKIELKIKVAQKNGLWNYGYDLHHSTGGGCHGVNFCTQYRKTLFYTSKNAAVIACIAAFLESSNFPKVGRNILKDYRNTLMHEQLSLF